MKIHFESQPLHSESAATEWMQRYENAYSRFAYGTNMWLKHNDDGTVTVHGTRYNSAD